MRIAVVIVLYWSYGSRFLPFSVNYTESTFLYFSLLWWIVLLLIIFPSVGCLQQPLQWPLYIHVCFLIFPPNIIQNTHLHGYLPPYPSLFLQPWHPAVCFPCSGHQTWWSSQLDKMPYSPRMLITALHFMLLPVFVGLCLYKERNCYV